MTGNPPKVDTVRSICPKYPSLPTVGIGGPLTRFAGRFVDSNRVRDLQAGFGMRTLRARGVIMAPDINRIYMMIGSTLASYRLDTFFSNKLGGPLTENRYENAQRLVWGMPYEKFLQWDGYTYAEGQFSGWQVYFPDGQDRLFGMDYDSRGYVYAAYSVFGWGVLQQNQDGNISLVTQKTVPENVGVEPRNVLAFSNAGSYYLIASSESNAVLWDVTNPATPVLVRSLAGGTGGLSAWSKMNGYVAMVDGQGGVKIYSTDAIVNGGAAQSFRPSVTNFVGVSSDGTSFWAAENGGSINLQFWKFTNNGGTWSAQNFSNGQVFLATGIRASAGFVTVFGLDESYRPNVRIFKTGSGTPAEVGTNNFFPSYYAAPPGGYAKPDGYTGAVNDAVVYNYGGRDYLFFSIHGIGDVYELNGPGTPIGPGPTPTPTPGGPTPTPTPTPRPTATPGGGGGGNPTPTPTDPPGTCNGNFGDAYTVNYSGTVTGCGGASNCPIGESVQFSPYQFSYPGIASHTEASCDSWSWNFGDGTSTVNSKSPLHTFTRSGTFQVAMTISNQYGSKQFTSNVVIGSGSNPTPTPTPGGGGGGGAASCSLAPTGNNLVLNLAGPVSGCNAVSPGSTCQTSENIVFQAQGLQYTLGSCHTVLWNFGDSATAAGINATHQYAAPGQYSLTMTVSNSVGSVSIPHTVIVVAGTGGGPTPTPVPTPNPTPTPNGNSCQVAPSGSNMSLSYNGALTGCNGVSPGSTCQSGEDVNFKAEGYFYTLSSCHTVQWSFGDSTTGTGITAKHQYLAPGQYAVSMTVSNGVGSVTIPSTVNVGGGTGAGPAPSNAAITATTTNAIIGNAVGFTASADPADKIASYNWTFGDNSSGTGASISHTYTAAGTYTVVMTARDAFSRQAQASKVITVTDANRYAFILPVVAHVPGQGGSRWRTDLQIFNTDPAFSPSSPMVLELEFKGVKKNLTVASSTLITEDLMAFFIEQLNPKEAARDDQGSMIVRGVGDHVPQIWTRTYTQDASGSGTYGSLLAAIPLDLTQAAAAGDARFYLPGLEIGSRFRTNIGVINPNNKKIDVKIVGYDKFALPLQGSLSVSLDPYEYRQINQEGLLAGITNIPNGQRFSLEVSTSGAQVITFYSLIDQRSNDPVYVQSIAADSAGSESLRDQVIPGVIHQFPWKSDLTVYNPDARTAQFDLIFYDQAGAEMKRVSETLAAGALLQLEDAANGDPFNVSGNSNGTVRMITTSPTVNAYPVIMGRTYSDPGNGTFGEGIPGFGTADANVRLDQPAYISGVRNNPAFQTNLGLVSVSDEPSRVRITLLSQSTGQAVGQIEQDLNAHQSIVLPNVIPSAGAFNSTADSGTFRVEVVSGSPVWAFASIIDKKTLDPEYLAASPAN
ncbi:MAG: PKD domain-containing protein [Acidobacteriota bacterium]